MGIQINGSTDTISAIDGSLTLEGGELRTVSGLNVTGVVTATSYIAGAGSTSAPSISPSGDSNTGIFFPSADTIAFGEGGVEAARIDSSGRFGIGTTIPGQKLHVESSSSTYIQVRNTGDSVNAYYGVDTAAAWVGSSTNHPLALHTNNTERARIDSSGRLLVGTDSSSGDAATNSQLVVAGSSVNANGALALTRNSANPSAGQGIGQIYFADSNGGRGAWIQGQSDGTWGSSDYPGRLVFSTTADGASSPTERMRIDSIGRTMIAQTAVTDFAALSLTFNNSTPAATPATGIAINQANAATGTLMGFRNSAGTVIGYVSNNNNGTITYNNTSDYRLKENVVPLIDAVKRVQELKPSRFNFIGFPGKTIDGFLAHEAQAVVPECVTGTKDEVDADGNPVYQGIDQSKLVPLLTAAMQEALAKIETLETANASQAATIAALDARLTALESA